MARRGGSGHARAGARVTRTDPDKATALDVQDEFVKRIAVEVEGAMPEECADRIRAAMGGRAASTR